MNATELQEEIESLAHDIQTRITAYMDRTGRTHRPLILIKYETEAPDYVGFDPVEKVTVVVTGSLTATSNEAD